MDGRWTGKNAHPAGLSLYYWRVKCIRAAGHYLRPFDRHRIFVAGRYLQKKLQ